MSNSRGFSSNRFLMEPLVWIPNLTSFKGDRREGCKAQLRIRKKSASVHMCVFETFDSFDYPSFHHSFSLLFSPSQSCRCTPELRTAQTGFFCSFLVKTSISSLTGYSRLAMRMDSWRAQAKQFQSGDAARHLCDQGTSSRTCLMDSRRWNRKAKTRKGKKKTLYADLSSCVIFTLLIKTNSPSISKS